METFKLDFVAVGPQRTGTSWLHEILRHHPSLCLPKNVKETWFFDHYYHKGLSWYASYFDHQQDSQICGEIGATYFQSENACQRLYQLNPNCKIIISLRDPVERAISLYQHHVSKGRTSPSWEEATAKFPEILEAGKYARYLPMWLDIFGAEQVKLILLEDIEVQPELTLKGLYNFLGVEEIELPEVAKKKVGAAIAPKHPWLAKGIAQVVRLLRIWHLLWIIEIGKKLGLKRVYYASTRSNHQQQNEVAPSLSPRQRLHLLAEYADDIAYVEKLLRRDLSA